MDDLVVWLRQQLDKDEWVAQGAARTSGAEWLAVGLQSSFDARMDDHIALHDPARVLREVEAKRRIVTTAEWFRERAAEVANLRTYDMDDWLENERLRVTAKVLIDTLSVIAAVYSDRPGYREEWKP